MNPLSNLNKILKKYLDRYDFSSNALPFDLKKWQDFLNQVNNHFKDIDQELYILERSSEISIRETTLLNKQLEDAQRLANIGRWYYYPSTKKLTVSKELYNTFGLDPMHRSRNYEEILKNVHYHDKQLFDDTIKNSLKTGIKGECEVRFIMPNKQFIWLYIICSPVENSEGVFENIEGIAMEITKRKESEEKILQLNKQIVMFARSAGMAEVATSILHNLGNILNSANVSLEILKENSSHSYLDKVLAAISYIDDHKATLDKYLTENEKGKLIPQFLIASAIVLKSEQIIFKKEVQNLNIHLNHIKQIVASQQNIAVTTAITEKVFLPETIDDALQMCARQNDTNIVKINKNYYNYPNFIETDRTKLLQILVNLIQNAKQATEENEAILNKEITISVKEAKHNQIKIIIKDNGIGIAPENQIKIFSFGYSDKKDGHGFGLHSSALFAKKMGGNLKVISKGLGKGATFTLQIPVSPH